MSGSPRCRLFSLFQDEVMGSVADNIIDLYQRHAGAWTNARGTRFIEKPWLERFSGLLPSTAAVLDLGCGSGVPIGRYFEDLGFSVTGVDSAPEMISLFKSNLPNQIAVVGDMRALSLDRSFSGLLAWDSFFHLAHDHQRAMFAAFREHALPGAALIPSERPSGHWKASRSTMPVWIAPSIACCSITTGSMW